LVICAGIAISDPEIRHLIQIAHYVFIDDIEILRSNRDVKLVPVNGILVYSSTTEFVLGARPVNLPV
jgi:hypothetical protein